MLSLGELSLLREARDNLSNFPHGIDDEQRPVSSLTGHTVHIMKGGLNTRPWKDLGLFLSKLVYEQAV